MSTLVYLVRHGESQWNARGLIQGQTIHPALTQAGRAQARLAAEQIRADLTARARAVTITTTSDLVRASQTADVIVDALGGRLRVDVRLREQHLGELQGLTRTQARQQTQARRDLDVGESEHDLRLRMQSVLSDLEPDAVHVLVSHRRALRQALAHLLGLPDGEQIAIGNGAVGCWDGERLDWLG